MDFLKNVTGSITKAVNFVVDKNRKAAMINRLKIVIKSEKETQMRAYAEIGKYYYKNMRDTENEQTEPFCAAVDNTSRRLNRAFAKLDELIAPACCDDDFAEADDDGFDEDGACSCGNDFCTDECDDDECDCHCGCENIAPDSQPDDSFEGFPRPVSPSQSPYNEEAAAEEAADDGEPPIEP